MDTIGILAQMNHRTRGHVLLRSYIQTTTGMTEAQLARDAEVTPMQISHLMSGRRRASLEVAVALERASQGIIESAAWMDELPREGDDPIIGGA